MKYRIVILRRARRDAREIYDWIADKSSSGALRWHSAMEEAIQRLRSNPLSCSRAEEADAITEYELRQMLFKTRRGLMYRIVFAVLSSEIQILRIRGPGQTLLTDEDL